MAGFKYVRVVAPTEYGGRRCSKRLCLEHHLVWWMHFGTAVPQGYLLHHKNEDTRDNRVENLELLSISQHALLHAAQRKKEAQVEVVCGNCRRSFVLMRSKIATRQRQSSSGLLFCSKKCSSKKQYADREILHGTVSAYQRQKCRCDVCREAHRTRVKEWKKTRAINSVR